MKLYCFSVINMKTTLQAFTLIFFQHRYQHTDATDFSMFSLAPMLPMFDVRCANRPNSNIKLHLEDIKLHLNDRKSHLKDIKLHMKDIKSHLEDIKSHLEDKVTPERYKVTPGGHKVTPDRYKVTPGGKFLAIVCGASLAKYPPPPTPPYWVLCVPLAVPRWEL